MAGQVHQFTHLHKFGDFNSGHISPTRSNWGYVYHHFWNILSYVIKLLSWENHCTGAVAIPPADVSWILLGRTSSNFLGTASWTAFGTLLSPVAWLFYGDIGVSSAFIKCVWGGATCFWSSDVSFASRTWIKNPATSRKGKEKLRDIRTDPVEPVSWTVLGTFSSTLWGSFSWAAAGTLEPPTAWDWSVMLGRVSGLEVVYVCDLNWYGRCDWCGCFGMDESLRLGESQRFMYWRKGSWRDIIVWKKIRNVQIRCIKSASDTGLCYSEAAKRKDTIEK